MQNIYDMIMNKKEYKSIHLPENIAEHDQGSKLINHNLP